jgi:delta 1-pyrroline-5-carboxylate dehydrogenase
MYVCIYRLVANVRCICFPFPTDMESFNKAALMEDEIFGPVMPIVRYSDLSKQVVPFVRARPKPLTLYVFSKKSKVSNYVLANIASGGAAVNECVMQIGNEHVPFGGVGDSGMGSYHGDASFAAFSHAKSVLIKSFLKDPSMRFPPYSKREQKVMLTMFKTLTRWPQIDEAMAWFQRPTNVVISVMALIIVGLVITIVLLLV